MNLLLWLIGYCVDYKHQNLNWEQVIPLSAIATSRQIGKNCDRKDNEIIQAKLTRYETTVLPGELCKSICLRNTCSEYTALSIFPWRNNLTLEKIVTRWCS